MLSATNEYATLSVVSTEPKTRIEPATAEALLTWVEAFPTKELEKRLTFLLRQRRNLDVEIRFLQAQVMRYRQYLQDLRPPDEQLSVQDSDGAEAAPVPTQRQHRIPKRMAVMRLLSETPGRTWRL